MTLQGWNVDTWYKEHQCGDLSEIHPWYGGLKAPLDHVNLVQPETVDVLGLSRLVYKVYPVPSVTEKLLRQTQAWSVQEEIKAHQEEANAFYFLTFFISAATDLRAVILTLTLRTAHYPAQISPGFFHLSRTDCPIFYIGQAHVEHSVSVVLDVKLQKIWVNAAVVAQALP
ncbi:WD repeat domain-containing protein 83 [Platysternon megacephalum]|uniref:WD repeat domain-containing protein 83 n=1 Tax=Platysternon megacephalum TaxID=55544 RepID=A0A4D9E0G1_9SAUR|nr:WD repeat domain-containing protein 83 [Platysternon megacephalum]